MKIDMKNQKKKKRRNRRGEQKTTHEKDKTHAESSIEIRPLTNHIYGFLKTENTHHYAI